MSKKYRNSVIVDEEKIIKKKKDNSVSELFNYLDSRGFNSHPEIIDEDEKTYTMKNINGEKYYEINEGVELIKVVIEIEKIAKPQPTKP